MVQEYPVLVPERAVVAVLLVPGRDPTRGGARPEDGPRDPARDEVLQAEGDHGHPEDDYDRLPDPPDYVPGQLERLIPSLFSARVTWSGTRSPGSGWCTRC